MPFDEMTTDKMQFVGNADLAIGQPQFNEAAQISKYDDNFSKSFTSAFVHENTIASAYNNNSPVFEADVDFNAFETAKELGHDDLFIDYSLLGE